MNCSVTNKTVNCEDPTNPYTQLTQISVVEYDADYALIESGGKALTGDFSTGSVLNLGGASSNALFWEVYFVGSSGQIPASSYWSINLKNFVSCGDDAQSIELMSVGTLVSYNHLSHGLGLAYSPLSD